MIECSIKGCDAVASEHFSEPKEIARWFRARVCQCAALVDKKLSCVCQSPPGPLKVTYWPNLDWWILGGVEEVTLCPEHRRLVVNEIEGQRRNDPSMDSEFPNPTNRH
jgi:hypothetical protein